MRDAVEMLPKGHTDLPRYLNSLASYLATRYAETEDTDHDSDYDSDAPSEGTEDLAESGDEQGSTDEEESADDDKINDLDEAIRLWQEAIRATGIARHDRAEYVNNLIEHLIYRYDSINDLEEAVRLIKDEVEDTAPDHPDRANVLKRIADHLDSIWDAAKDDGLDIKIAVRQDALNAIPKDLPNRAKYLNHLASNFSSRHERKGSRKDLEAAIRLEIEAINALPRDSLHRAELLINLSISLYHRFEVTSAVVDLEEAICLADEAVRMGTKQQVHYQHTLAHYVLQRYQLKQNMDDLNLAIHLTREVIRATSEHHPQRNEFLHQLAACLDARLKRKLVTADLQIALRVQKAAVDTETDDPVKKAYCLSNLADHLEFTSRGITRRKTDMGESFRIAERAIDTIPEGHPRRVTLLTNLGIKYDRRYWIGKDPNDRERATSLYMQALNVENGVALDRISAGQVALRDHITDKDWERARSVSEAIVKLFPRLPLNSLPQLVQQGILSDLSHIAGDAASVVLQTNGTAVEALEILEAGWGIIASFLIESRADISKLKDSEPLLYLEYIEVRDRASLPFEEDDRSNVPMAISQRYKDIQRLKDLESAIRMEEGFERFLLPPTTADLIQQARRGPIVVFNATKTRSDALLITESEGITHLPLGKLKLRELLKDVDKLVGKEKLSVGLLSTKSKRQQELQRILKWLWDVAVRPVLKKLKFLTPVASRPLLHIWWVTNGHLGLIPIHAAGDSKKTTSDYVISQNLPSNNSKQANKQANKQAIC